MTHFPSLYLYGAISADLPSKIDLLDKTGEIKTLTGLEDVSKFKELWEKLDSRLDEDFVVFHDKKRFRAHRIKTIAQEKTFFMREIELPRAKLSDLNINHVVSKHLVTDAVKGGLLLVMGEAGSGKSTLAATVLIERLSLRKGVALTVEDPPEFDFTGVENGICIQCEVDMDHSFSHLVKGSLRSFPAGDIEKILFVGEVRDAETAVEVIRASISGFFVVATIHSNTLIDGCERLISLASDNISRTQALSMLSSGLSMAVLQSTDGISFNQDFYLNTKRASAYILSDNLKGMANEIKRQESLLALSRPLSES